MASHKQIFANLNKPKNNIVSTPVTSFAVTIAFFWLILYTYFYFHSFSFTFFFMN